MGWVKQATPVIIPRHPVGALDHVSVPLDTNRPDGRLGDIWRCDACRELWYIGRACDPCELYGGHDRGQCLVGNKWRKAGPWLRCKTAMERWWKES